jgi:DNA-binding response OmpR family regulator
MEQKAWTSSGDPVEGEQPLYGRRILVIDDDPDFVALVGRIFGRAGATVDSALSGEQSLCQFRARPPDLVLLDVMMPGMDGWQVCASIRALSRVPIMMLTALNGYENIVRGLDYGADDFVTKSTSNREIVARAHALLRRSELAARRSRWPAYCDDNLAINPERRLVPCRTGRSD